MPPQRPDPRSPNQIWHGRIATVCLLDTEKCSYRVLSLNMAAYFERSVGNLWEMVYRPSFERHLRAHLSDQVHYHDATWYALRNVVYAAGCKIYRSDFSAANSSDIQRECRGYFGNALSVHSELLLNKPTLRSVRALLIMVR
jgi:hypothetical protein